MRFFLTILLVLGCLAFGLGPLILYGILHTGSILLTVFGVILGLLSFRWNCLPNYILWGRPLCSAKWWRFIRQVVAGILLFVVGCGVVLSGLIMVWGGWSNPPKEGESYTVVILGCKVIDDQPSLMLRHRLNTALEYLKCHPDAPVIVTGGAGPMANYTEGEVEAAYLLDHGIEAERIYIENKSVNTMENFKNAAAIIRQEGLPEQVIIVTDAFHQWRGAQYARRAGLSGEAALSASTPWGLFPSYLVREMAAMALMYLPI